MPAHLCQVPSPLSARLSTWTKRLAPHPDRDFANYILSGIEHGFRVGFEYSHPLSSAKRNMLSASQHPKVVENYLGNERAEGRILGPINPRSVPGLHTSRFGVIPKGHSSGKWRLITDLSSPEGASVNDGISPTLCSLSYTSVDKVAKAAQRLGPGALLAKVDIKSAYRLVPVHPDDRPLLGVMWKGAYYIDAMLPFGLRSAPKIFTAVPNALEWCVRRRGVRGIDHYLDDFVIVAPPASDQCEQYLAILEDECEVLGIKLAPEKKHPSTTRLPLLGMIIDTVTGRLYLPEDKLVRLRLEVDHWLRRKACRRRELESLVGTLQHAAKVIYPGRSFVRRGSPAQSLHLAESAIQGEGIRRVLEWSGLFPSPSIPPHGVCFRCLRHLGLWGLVSGQVVAVRMAPGIQPGHHVQRDVCRDCCSCSLGQRVAGTAHFGSL